ncbi:probable serine/threonine-protein kinase DDB_G0282963 [Contarinia nasturtii]|uniref:probable serine/threonine-protein kinase DDB_G0282963 n=1 Tax=Contarinia nasturtii TaxID=265458 RepID=UPI0012D4994A|nr:probable serine/threonine-protein kinase DDB_G0282963 [Contarinia nasturtii]
MEGRGTLFREIHKNTWLKRVIADNRKIPVGIKKPEKYWVVFCVHDDCEALLEGYAEPRQAPSHSPDWTVSLQTTLHISHTLVPSENEYEFVIALAGETLRFNASSWEIMQEWVDTLRLKLREMKILSPKENLYSKLPEVRPPLLPTRDPTRDPLPATPPVPAAIVPGVERIVNTTQTSRTPLAATTSTTLPLNSNALHVATANQQSSESTTLNSSDGTERIQNRRNTSPSLRNQTQHDNENDGSSEDSFAVETIITTSTPISSTSNTLSQNLIKMLYPLPNFSQQTNEPVILQNDLESNDSFVSDASTSDIISEPKSDENKNEHVHSLARTFAANVLFDANTSSSSKRTQNNVANTTTLSSSALPNNRDVAEDSISVDSSVYGIYPTPEPIVIPRPQTTRGSAAKSKKVEPADSQSNDTTADGAAATTNITIIQVSSANKINVNAQNESAEKPDLNYMNNVQIIPSNYLPNDQSAVQVTTVQVTNDSNTPNCQQIKEQSVLTSSVTKNILSTSLEAHDDIQSARQFGAVTNISIGANEKQAFQQQEQLHYEQVFITHTPSGASISTGNNTESNEIQPKINRIKVDSAHRLPSDDSAEIRPSTSTSSTVTFSVAAIAAAATDTNISNSVSKSKDSTKSSHENDLLSSRRPVLSRGVTEAVIMRPSRKDVNMLLNRINPQGNHCSPSEFHTNSQHRDSAEQRKRSSSTSDTQRNRTRSNNNNVSSSGNASNNNSEFRRTVAQPNQPFRPNVDISLRASGRMTLREQQVMQLRREMCHVGGVRLQLRKKDCTSSIAFVDAFGAAWISGWKQKEHPMLYNALHIGDQIISIGGVTVTNAKEANKIINNSTGQFIEFIIRRVPFGRVYAIRREIDRQCLGLIRDGNTATIVDVVPNSLSARHGLPPKAQSCDGLSLTFWVLTEINGRPLNLFFKDNEVRDRLNAVGRDISILVQPSDLVSKLKKQLKSLRNHKDYIVQ